MRYIKRIIFFNVIVCIISAINCSASYYQGLGSGIALGDVYSMQSGDPYNFKVVGFYENATEAQNACPGSCPGQNLQNIGIANNDSWRGYFNPTEINGWYETYVYAQYAHQYFTRDYLYDDDGDGIPLSYDPYKNDATPFNYKVIADQKDAQGNLVSMLIKTDRGDMLRIGNYDENITEYFNIPVSESYDKSSADLVDLLNEQGSDEETRYLTFSDDLFSDVSLPGHENYEELNTGNGNEGNTDDTDYFSDIVNNTKGAVENQQEISNTLKDILNELRDQKKITYIGGGSSTTTNNEVEIDNDAIGQSVAEKIESNHDEHEAEENAEKNNQLSNIDNNMPDFSNSSYGENDKPVGIGTPSDGEQNEYNGIIDTFLSYNPIATIISGSGVSLSNINCSFSWSYAGHQIDYSMCDYKSYLNLFGGLILSLAGIKSIILIAKG